ncbi:MAG: CBS and ACT domain-containing protein [Chloroflexota bacterium]|nr:CBS and ACT domain-containing protein [Chloroflexota bacterium]
MFVRDRMNANPVTVTRDLPFQEALQLMRENKVRRLPVVDKKGRLVGIVSERDLLYASPSPASSLSVWELQYLLSKIDVGELMTKNVVSVSPNTPIEDAARLMVDNRIGGLPVIDDSRQVVGVITETDIFKTFVEMFGGGESGVRLALKVPERKGVLAALSQAILDLGGNIVSVGSFGYQTPGERELVVKVQGVSQAELVDTLESLGDHVVDAREV